MPDHRTPTIVPPTPALDPLGLRCLGDYAVADCAALTPASSFHVQVLSTSLDSISSWFPTNSPWPGYPCHVSGPIRPRSPPTEGPYHTALSNFPLRLNSVPLDGSHLSCWDSACQVLALPPIGGSTSLTPHSVRLLHTRWCVAGVHSSRLSVACQPRDYAVPFRLTDGG